MNARVTLGGMEIEASAPAPEAAPAEAIEPVVETPEVPAIGELVDVETETATTEAAEPADPFQEFGGRETIEAAHRLYEASRTEDGVIQLFLEAGRSLGLGLKDMQALFESLGGEGTAPTPEGPDPDEPITWADFQALQQKQAQEQAAREADAQQASARAAVQKALTDLKLDPADPATKIILEHGDKYVNGDFSEANIANAVRRGHADFQAILEKKAQEYVQTKRQQATSVPSAPAGNAAPATPPAEEPKDVAAAIKAARKALGLSS